MLCSGKCLAIVLLSAVLAAQNQPPKPAPGPAPAAGAKEVAAPTNEAELAKQATTLLVAFARTAETNKMPARARDAYETIVAHYEPDNATARAGLGWKRVKTEWQQATPKDKLPANSNNMDQRNAVTAAWTTTSKRLGVLHRDLGVALQSAGEADRSRSQFERTLLFLPDDAQAHKGLGHEQIDGFFGSSEDIAFVKRFRAMVEKARQAALQEVRMQPLADDALPRELRASGYSYFGSRAAHVTYWVMGSAEQAERCTLWHERALPVLEHLVGTSPETRRLFEDRPLRWVGIVRTAEQRRHLLDVSQSARGEHTLDQALLFDGIPFQSFSGAAMWKMQADDLDPDAAVALATKYGLPTLNPGLSEGLVHAMTWMMVGTTRSAFMALPSTTTGRVRTTFDPRDWLNLLREEVDAGKDWPLVQIPRERIDNFRDAARRKSWTFMLWLLARHPDKWVTLLATLGRENRTPEQVAKVFEDVLGRPVVDVESEWRAWIRSGSAIGRVCGFE